MSDILKGVITWVGVNDAVPAEVRLYDRLFTEAHPEADGKDFLTNLNPDSLKVLTDRKSTRLNSSHQ